MEILVITIVIILFIYDFKSNYSSPIKETLMVNYEYKFDITPLLSQDDNGQEKDRIQMRYDLYGMYGTSGDYTRMAEIPFQEGCKIIENMTQSQLRKADLSKLHPNLCWKIYYAINWF